MRHSLSSHSGYLIIDHKDSPGIKPEDIPERLRSSTQPVGAGQVYETDVQHCTHCQRAIVLYIVNKKNDIRDYCSYCHHYICRSCAKILKITGKCIPFKQVFDKANDQAQKGQIILTDL